MTDTAMSIRRTIDIILDQRATFAATVQLVGPSLTVVELACAECGCVVDAGVRIVVCNDRGCCCADLPLRHAANTKSLTDPVRDGS